LLDVASVCFELGNSCGSTALIYAMHQIQVATLVHEHTKWHQQFLAEVASEQLLLGSVTSEVGVGGSIRTSKCAPIDLGNGQFSLHKEATTISYGSRAQALLVTSRRNNDSDASDQILSVVKRDQYQLQLTSEWDTMGMRSTCSHGFIFEAKSVPYEQVFQTMFSDIASKIMLPVSHILWASAWLGIATDALTRARAYLRAQAKSNSSANMPPGATRLVEAVSKLKSAHSMLKSSLLKYQDMKEVNPDIAFTVEMNNIKTFISNVALDCVNEAMMICGISGYKKGTRYSVERHLRDIHSARLMVSNDRIMLNNASFVVAQRANIVEF
jgi:acyl-CoA dehydrogenase